MVLLTMYKIYIFMQCAPKSFGQFSSLRADAGIVRIGPIPAPAYRPPSMYGVCSTRILCIYISLCMAEIFIQLSIKRPTDIGAGCALLAGRQQPDAWFETGFGFLARFWV